ncbi:MAG: hypothetical protein ACKO4M_11160 [Betaproteobacteria bacterium]
MNAYIATYLVFGAVFGMATFSVRHLFSEGPHKPENTLETQSLSARVFWVLVCTFLWPVMVLTGMNSAHIIAKRKRQRPLVDI